MPTMYFNQMSEAKRRRVFWFLKKCTSYTAWQAATQAYEEFVKAWLWTMRTADAADVDDFNMGATKHILDGRTDMKNGLRRLGQGDRRVWRRGENGAYATWGELARACSAASYVDRIMDPQEYVFDWMKNKNVVLARFEEMQLHLSCMGIANESMNHSEPAPLNAQMALATVHPIHGVPLLDARYLNFPKLLPKVPASQNVVVVTGEDVPYDGIYEPEWVLEKTGSTGLLSWIDNFFILGGRSSAWNSWWWYKHRKGCMNYLLAHTAAPLYKNFERGPCMSVTWRLVWKDERYADGQIPADESPHFR